MIASTSGDPLLHPIDCCGTFESQAGRHNKVFQCPGCQRYFHPHFEIWYGIVNGAVKYSGTGEWVLKSNGSRWWYCYDCSDLG